MTDDRLTQPGPDPALGDIHLASRNDTAPIARSIAVLGTGKMGSAIAARLSAAGFQVVLWNRTRSRAEALGFGTVADTPAGAARAADMVVSSLTGPAAVLTAYLGPGGALSAGAGKLFIEMSTAGPDLVSSLAAQVAAAGGHPRRRADHRRPAGRPGRRGHDPGGWRRCGRRRGRPGAERARNGAPHRATGQRRAAQARGQQHARRRHPGGGRAAGGGRGRRPGPGRRVLGPAARRALARGAASRPHRGSPHAATLRPARPAQGRRPGAVPVRPRGRGDAAHSVGGRMGQRRRGIDPRSRHQRRRAAVPAVPTVD